MRLGAGILPALVVFFAGCGSTGSSADASAELEALIREQLPAEAKRLTGSRAFVSDVGCINSSGSSYQCIAAIQKLDPYAVQSYMGHQHYSTTQRYLHHKPRREDAAALVEAFEVNRRPTSSEGASESGRGGSLDLPRQ